MIPEGFQPRSTVHGYFNAWQQHGTLDEIMRVLRESIKVKVGRNKLPSASIIDNQSSKTAQISQNVGFDGAKKIKCRKCHLAVDVLGLPFAILVHSAGIDERSDAKL
jgi:putative transposase